MKSIANMFNKSADHCYKIANEKGSLSFAFLSGVAAMPFSPTVGMLLMAGPTIYAGFGLVQRGLAKGLDYFAPKAP